MGVKSLEVIKVTTDIWSSYSLEEISKYFKVIFISLSNISNSNMKHIVLKIFVEVLFNPGNDGIQI